MPTGEAGNATKTCYNAKWRRPLLNDTDIETLLKGLGLYAAKNVYNASEAYRLARAMGGAALHSEPLPCGD